MKFCKDCKHHNKGPLYDLCGRNLLREEVSLVTGKTYFIDTVKYCSDEMYGNCGKEAVYFESTWFYKLKQKVKGLFCKEN